MGRATASAATLLGRVAAAIRRRPVLAAILAVAFLLRVAWLLVARPEPVSDFAAYRDVALGILDNGRFGVPASTALYLPGHPAVLAALALVSRSVAWLSFGMVVLSTLACHLVYLLGRALTGRERVALVAAGAAAVSPTFVLFSPVLATEHLFTVLMLLVLLLAARLQAGAPRAALGAGALLGLAALTRGEGLFYVPVVAALVWFAEPSRPPVVRRRLVALVVAGAALVVTPWVIRNAVVVTPGVTLSTVGGINFYFAHNPTSYGWIPDPPWAGRSDIEANRIGWEQGLDHIRDEPFSLLKTARTGTEAFFESPDYALFWSTREVVPAPERHGPVKVPFGGLAAWALSAMGGLYLALAAASALLWRMWPRLLRLAIPGVALATWLGHAVVFWAKPRFRYFLDFTMTILVALVVVTLWDAARSGRKRAEAARSVTAD